MRKKLIIAGVCLVGVLALGFGIYQSGASSSEPELSKEEVENLVQEQYPGTITTTDLEKNEDGAIYKATTESSEQNDNNQAEENDSNKEPSTNEPGQTEEKKENGASNAMLSQDAAKEIALKEFAGTVVDLELDEDDGRKIYEIEIENGEDEATVEIDAYTGEILVLDIDIDD